MASPETSTDDLPRSSPSEQGVDARGVVAFADALETLPDVEPHSLMLLRHGYVVAEGWWAPYAPDRVHLLFSLSKSFTSTALGFAVAEGLVSLDEPVLAYFPELADEVTDERTRRMLVRHVASMASGHRQDMIEPARRAHPDDLVRGFLLLPPEEEPGSVFAYNQPCTFTLGAIIARRAGQSLTEYLRPRLFEPLGIEDYFWLKDSSGRELGFSGLHARTDAIARLGQLYLQQGSWQGRQLLSPEWVAEATTAHSYPQEGPIDWTQGYGFQFWRHRHGYRGDGAYGQFCVVLPEQDAVLAMTGAGTDMQAVLDAAWEHLLPAMEGPGDPVADAELVERLSRLELPGPDGEPAPTHREEWSGMLPVAGAPQLVCLELEHTPDAQGGGWVVALVAADGGRVDGVRIGGEAGWSVTDAPATHGGPVPVASRGGWVGDELHLDVLFLETPHRLRIRATESGADATWATTPLHDPALHQLRAPR